MEDAYEGARESWWLHGSREPRSFGNPAAGTGLTYKVPGAVEQELLSISFVYAAAAGGGVRTPFIRFLDWQGVAFCDVAAPFTIAATFTSRVTFAVGINQFGANNAASIGAPIPPMRLGDGLSFIVQALAIQAGDTITQASMFLAQWPLRPEGSQMRHGG